MKDKNRTKEELVIVRAAELLFLNKLGKSTGPDEFVINRKDGSQRTVEITERT